MFAYISKIRRNDIVQLVGLVALIALILGALMLTRPREPLSQAGTPRTPALSTMPLAFEPNVGQTDRQVKFLAHSSGGLLFFTPSEVVLSLPLPQVSAAADAAGVSPANVRVQFIRPSEELQVVQGSILAGKVNYYIDSNPSNWHTSIPTYGGVTYRGLYPGIDLSYTGTGATLKGTYIVAPGADPGAIAWRYVGVEQASVDTSGSLQLEVAGIASMKLSEQAPVAWQEINGRRQAVSASYTQDPDSTFRFSIGNYNPAYPLTIDPTLIFSTYLGGSGNDGILAVAERPYAMATADNPVVVVAGYTLSTDFPTILPHQPNNGGGRDAFVSAMDPRGSGIYFSTYLGGSSDDVAYGVAALAGGFGGFGDIVVTGVTTSTNFPTMLPYQPNNAGGQDAFMAMFSSYNSYQLTYSTYFGGSGNDAAYAAAFARSSGNCCPFPAPYFAGSTTSTNFPTILPYQPLNAGGQDAFLVHFPYTLQLPDFSTYLGGSGDDTAYGLSVNVSGEPYLTGSTNSTNFPRQAAYQTQYGGGATDAFLTRFAYNAASLQFSTYLGGNGADRGNGVAVDGVGDCYVTGATDSSNFPTYAAYQPALAGSQDAFVTKMHQDGSSLGYSTYLGGSAGDEGKGIAVDSAGFSYATGWTDSTDFPAVNAVQPSSAGGRDAFVTKLQLDGSAPIYSTYLGGSATDLGVAVAVQTQEPGLAYIGGQTGSGDYPVATPVQPNNAGGEDSLVSTIYDRCGPYHNYEITQTVGVNLVPGTVDIGNHCDDCSTLVTLPFTFHLYDAAVTALTADSNGYLQYNGGISDSFNYCLPAAYWNWISAYSVVPHLDNLRTDCTGCGIFTSVTGQAPNRIFNVEWRAQLVVGGAVNFEARLYEGTDSRFDFVYGSVAGNGDSATIGVQKGRGFLYTEYSCNLSSLSNGLQLSFTQPPCPNGTPATETPVPTDTPTDTPTYTPTSTDTPTDTPTSTSTATTEPTACPVQFTDVPQGSTFYPYVRCLACRGYVSGYACGGPGEPCNPTNDPYFRPNNNVTRGQLSKIISNAAGFNDPPGAQLFEDVLPGSTFYDYIYRLANRGYMSGYPCGGPGEPCGPNNLPYFRPNANATRGQISKIVSNAAGFNDPPGAQRFEDVLPGSTFYDFIQRLASRSIMSGYPCGGPGEPCGPNNLPYFRPNANATRGQTSKIVANTFFPNCQTPGRK